MFGVLFIHGNEKAKPGQYRLILASNRDEYYSIPTQEAFFCEETKVIGGRYTRSDQPERMFLGLACKNNNGPKIYVSSILNLRGVAPPEGTLGRGAFVKEFLTNSNQQSPKEFMKAIDNDTEKKFNGYNFLITEIDELGKIKAYLHSNFPKKLTEFENVGTLALGTSTYETPFTKVVNGKATFENIVSKNLCKHDLIAELLELLKNPKPQLPDPEMQKRTPDMLQHVNAIFTKVGDVYGTRTHTIILVDYDFNVEYIESTLDVQSLRKDEIKWNQTTIKTQMGV